MKRCTHCGEWKELEEYHWIDAIHTRRKPECKLCRNQKQNERNRERPSAAKEETEILVRKPYKLIYDPDNSWGFNSHFVKEEINCMLQFGYLCRGTKFQHQVSGRIYTVIEDDDKLLRLEKA